MTKTIRPAPEGTGTFAEIGEENQFEGTQTADVWATPLPSVKGHPDTQALRNFADVPVVSYAPDHIASDVYMPVVSEILVKTAAYTILATEAYNYIFTNFGAGASVTFTLPIAVVGMEIFFYLSDADDLVIDPNGSERIWGATDTGGDTITATNIGDHMVLKCLYAGGWSVMSSNGTWTEEV